MPEDLNSWFQRHKNRIIVILLVIVALDLFVYRQIFFAYFQNQNLRLYFLDVGQGDSELVILPGGVKILIDGGPPNGKILEELGELLPPTDRYLDLVIVSHPQLDHFGGLIEVLKRYQIGLLVHNGRAGTATAFEALKQVIQKRGIQTIKLGAGDKISHLQNSIKVLSPDNDAVRSREPNDTGLVLELDSWNTKNLFTADIGPKIEDYLLRYFDSRIDVLKVAHHGSRYSSTADFIEAVKPKLAAIEVGVNSYGHPTKETLGRLAAVGAKIYRTDRDGTVEIVIDGESIKIIK